MNSFLQDLVDEMSNESSNTDQQYSELLNYAVEASFNDVNRTLGFMQAITDNYDHHFSSGDESFENYQAYRQSTAVIFATSGMDIPVEIMVPSFESQSFDSYSTEAEEKKGNILQRAWEGFLKMLKRAWDFVSGNSKKTKEELVEVKAKVETAKKTVAVAAADVKKGVPASKVNKTAPEDTSKSEKVVNTLSEINFEYKLAEDFMVSNKLQFKPVVDRVMASAGVRLANRIKGPVATTELEGLLSTSKVVIKPLSVKKDYTLNAEQVKTAIDAIDLGKVNDLTKTTDDYLTSYKKLMVDANTTHAEVKKNTSSSSEDRNFIESMRRLHQLYTAIYNDLHKATSMMKETGNVAEALSKKIASITA